ncbi:GNAT family N-acetyltransferase [Mariniblastus sp.]|nr:GNAT family N-acetyltransferase [Mariniblastus sp.]
MSASDLIQLRLPRTDPEYDRYFDLRWRVLREPWGQPRGSERDSLDESGVHVMAEVAAGELLGAGCLHLNHLGEAQIRYMAVEEFSRGKGVGRAMVEWLEQKAHDQNATAVVLNSRKSAIGFYERLGYSVVEQRETLFGEIEHFWMRKNLTDIV